MNDPGTRNIMVHKKLNLGDASSWMFYCLLILVASLPLSEFGMSISQFLLLGFWLFEGADYNIQRRNGIGPVAIIIKNIGGKFRRLFSNHLLLAFLAIFFLHIVALLYSSDLQYGFKDLRVKIPLLALPVLIGTSSAINLKRFNILLLVFVLAVISGSLISLYVYLTHSISDPREISIFISHIRFGLFVSFSIFILIGFLFFNTFKSKQLNILFLLSAVWLVVFLFILKSFTGIIITVLMFILVFFLVLFQNRRLIFLGIITVAGIFAGGYYYLKNVASEFKYAKPIDRTISVSSAGNAYSHDTINYGIEYGAYVGSYIVIDELRESWNNRSILDFDGLDNKGQQLKYTLIRYLHSKGYHKDANAVNQLTNEDIQLIENGVANARYIHGYSIRGYLEQVIMGYSSYKKANNPNASSLMQRIEYWKTSVYIINQKLLFGEGTGDVKLAFEKAYNETNSTLLPEFRHRAHNQFLAITIAMGIIGLLVFLVSLLYPPIMLGKFNNYYYIIFFAIAVISFLTEDTLETQAGASFFAFYSALLLFGIRKEVDEKYAINRIIRNSD